MEIYHANLKRDVMLRYHDLFPEVRLNVLRSFGLLTAEENSFLVTHRDKLDKVALDSGTFTMQNKPSSELSEAFEGYKNYLLRFGRFFDFYFNFDIDSSRDGFKNNLYYQKRLENEGLTPVPVIHNLHGEEVGYYIDKGYRRIAIRSSESENYDDLWPAIDRLYSSWRMVHLFGTTRFDLISVLPISSCDSSNVYQTGAYGDIKWWNPRNPDRNKTDTIHLEEYFDPDESNSVGLSSYAFKEDFETYLNETLHITTDDLIGHHNERHRQLANLHYLVKLEYDVCEEHRKRGIVTYDRM